MQQFWAHQTEAKRNTVWLVLLYAALLLVFGVIAAYGVTYLWEMLDPADVSRYWDGRKWVYTDSGSAYVRFGAVMVIVPLVVWGLSLFSPAANGAGGKGVAESLDGALVSPQTTRFAERRLLNVVEEMAIASGVPVPPVYVLEHEAGINAFAAGTSVNDAVIGVTRGTLEYLDRDELQAVIAHEFSHILNQDMRINMRFACLLFGLMCIAAVGKSMLHGLGRSRPRSNSKGGGGLAILLAIALACFLIGLITHFLGTIIQAAVNRQREFLADASSVQFTRSPGLASALKKIGGLAEGSKLTETNMASNYSHFFFCSAASSLFSSHPALEKRIKRIDPQWDGTYPKVESLTAPAQEEARISTSHASTLAGIAAAGRILAWQHPEESGSTFEPGTWDYLDQDTDRENVHALSSSPQTSPEALAKLHAACREPLDACYMIFGLLLDDDPAMREKQIATCDSDETKKQMAAYKDAFSLVDPAEYVPLIERAIPALKRLSDPQYKAFCDIMTALVHADGVMSFEEWLLYRLVTSQVGAQYFVQKKRRKKTGDPDQMAEAAVTILAAVARLETENAVAEKAFAASCEGALDLQISGLPEKPSIEKLDESLTIIQVEREDVREAVMLGALIAVAADKTVTPREAMLLRVFSLCLGVPLTHEIWVNSLAAYEEVWADISPSAPQ
ncbi:MAG: Protease HtpX [Desulfovibrio sp.]